MYRVQNFARGWKYAILEAGLSRGIIPAAAAYTKFIILSAPRSGTNMLRTTLASHPQIHAYGEIFNENHIPTNYGFPASMKQIMRARLKEPEAYIQELVFRKYLAGTKAVGFKMMYHHPQSASYRRAWSCLAGIPELRVIHLKRRNLLEVLLSQARSDLTGKWASYRDSKGAETQPRIELSAERCEQAFENLVQTRVAFDQRFKPEQLLEVWYEDLVDNFECTLSSVYEFLGVANCSARPATIKQRVDSLDTAISNYPALKAHFEGTPWASFFV